MKRGKILLLALAPAALLPLQGCKTYDIEVEIAPDGSGTRRVELSMDSFSESDKEMDKAEFLEYFILDKAKNWSSEVDSVRESGIDPSHPETPAGENTIMVLRSCGKVSGPGGWEPLSGDIHIRGNAGAGPYGEAFFINQISFVMDSPEEPGICAYTERFVWTGLRESIVGFYSDLFAGRIAGSYPSIDQEGKEALKGLMEKSLGSSIDTIMSSEDEERKLRELADSLYGPAADIISSGGGETDISQLSGIIWSVLHDSEDELDTFFEENLPGLSMAFATDLMLKITMPGRIVETNGEIAEDTRTVTFRMGLVESMSKPFEAYVKSRH